MPSRYFDGRDGARLAYRELGRGPTVVLWHGFLAASRHWLEHGDAGRVAAAGYRVVLPDLRGHGDSMRSHDPRAYPVDVLVDDGLALVEHLGLDDYTLGGYSLGGRVALQMLARGARPQRAIVAGQGLAAVTEPPNRDSALRRALGMLAEQRTPTPDSPEAGIAHWAGLLGGDARALLLVLDSLSPTPLGALRGVRVPVLVVAGSADTEQIDSSELAAVVPGALFCQIPGDHWTAFSRPALVDTIADFLADGSLSGGDR